MQELGEVNSQLPAIKVFGSAILRVPPDTASIAVAVARMEEEPEAAFASAREGAQHVTAYLNKANVDEFGSSRVSLSKQTRYRDNEHHFLGYLATIEFNVLIREIDKMEIVLTGMIAAGGNDLRSVSFQTTRLKELRAEARRRAVQAAREKASLYCTAAGVTVGDVISIEDVNPESLSGRYEGHSYREPAPPDEGSEPGAIDPAAITVGAAVNIVYRINGR